MPRSGDRSGTVTARTLENAAARYVERFGGTTRRLRAVLVRRIDAAEVTAELRAELVAVVEAIVGRYEASGQIDDAAFAAARANRLVRRGVAPGVIRGRLAAEGLDAQAALAEVAGDVGLRAACAFIRRRRLGAFGEAGEGALAKLARGGFSYDLARRVLAMERDAVEEVLRG